MSELKPCPFCGGEARTASKDYGDTHYWRVFCDTPSCAMCMTSVFHSEAEAIEAWNTRADDYRHAAEYWQRMYENTFTERTCEELGSLRIWQECYVWSHDLSCGHEVDTLDMEPPNYCPNCGAKVVS